MAQPATIFVSLPSDARLMVDDQQTVSTSAERRFTTPPLEPGTTYYYTLKMSVDRNGRPVSTTRQVNVRAGEESRVSFTLPRGDGVGEESEPVIKNQPKKAPPPDR